MDNIKFGIKIALGLVFVLGLIVISNIGFGLINQPDDIAVVMGYGILIPTIAVLVGICRYLFIKVRKQIEKKLGERSNENT